jgi:hypothetical protein
MRANAILSFAPLTLDASELNDDPTVMPAVPINVFSMKSLLFMSMGLLFIE